MAELGKINYSKYNLLRNDFLVGHKFWKIPFSSKKPYDISLSSVLNYNCPKILDFGANDKNYLDFLNTKKIDFSYKSFDQDRSLYHDYYDIDQINERFDIVCMFAVIEHIQPKHLIDNILPKIYSFINPGGTIIIYTNNIYHPLGIRMDLDHEIGYGLRELHAIMTESSFKTFRYYRNGGVNKYLFPFYNFISKYILFPYRVDFATSVYYEAKKITK